VKLIPAIDLKDGRCVRLVQGRMSDETVYSDDPLSQAESWIGAGASRLHIVDLDGAVQGRPAHAETIRSIVESFPQVEIQIGGGIRTIESAGEYLDAGAAYVIIGTRAVKEPEFISQLGGRYPGKVIAGVDVVDGKVAIDGWTDAHAHDIVSLMQELERCGAASIIYTDIRRDGMLIGANVAGAVALARQLTVPVIIAGGVKDMDDLRRVMQQWQQGIGGLIAGRALYEGTLKMSEALSYISQQIDSRSN